jgi:Ran-binding protein 1
MVVFPLLVTSDMNLTHNIGSDRSWVWNVASDSSDDGTAAQTLAIRFANPENAAKFKEAFENAQKINAELKSGAPDADEPKEAEEKEAAKADE